MLKSLSDFAADKKFNGSKGSLSVALVATDEARRRGLPLEPEQLMTGEGTGGQVAVGDLATGYNEMMGAVETDPSLRIELRR